MSRQRNSGAKMAMRKIATLSSTKKENEENLKFKCDFPSFQLFKNVTEKFIELTNFFIVYICPLPGLQVKLVDTDIPNNNYLADCLLIL
jgi:hypothetical protein